MNLFLLLVAYLAVGMMLATIILFISVDDIEYDPFSTMIIICFWPAVLGLSVFGMIAAVGFFLVWIVHVIVGYLKK